MFNTAVIFADGFEEVEALTVVDLLRRAGLRCDMVSLADSETATGSHGIQIAMDRLYSDTDLSEYDGIILPGGQPGTSNLAADPHLRSQLKRACDSGKLVAAICAAPTVLANADLLSGKKAVCYPGLEHALDGALHCSGPVAVDGNLITGRSVGTAIPFALALVSYFLGEDASLALASSIVF